MVSHFWVCFSSQGRDRVGSMTVSRNTFIGACSVLDVGDTEIKHFKLPPLSPHKQQITSLNRQKLHTLSWSSPNQLPPRARPSCTPTLQPTTSPFIPTWTLGPNTSRLSPTVKKPIFFPPKTNGFFSALVLLHFFW